MAVSPALPEVRVGDAALRVEAARCSAMPVNIRWPGHQRELDQTEICSFARFDFTGSAEVCVTPRRAFTNVVVRPVSAKVDVQREGDSVRFTIPKAGAYSVEFDGRHRNLMLFAHAGVANHPGDLGMAAIANAILKTLFPMQGPIS